MSPIRLPIFYCAATHRSPHGWIRSGWHHENGHLIYTCTIPPGSSATFILDDKYKLRRELPSGTYRFRLEYEELKWY